MAYLDSNGLTKVWAKIVALFNSHVNNKNNPHEVTLSKLGVTSTATELNYCDGVTSNIQTQLNSKVNTSSIVNDLTSGGATAPLSAEQGKELKEQLDDITDHGFKGKSVLVKTGSVRDLANGLYTCYQTVSDLPEADKVYLVQVIEHSEFNYKCIQAWLSINADVYHFECKSNNGVWSAWRQIATQNKTPILFTELSGYTIIWQDCYEMNGLAHINIAVKKTDESDFGSTSPIAVVNAPYTPPHYHALAINAFTSVDLTGLQAEGIAHFSTGKGIWVRVPSGTKSINITGISNMA